MSELRAGLTTIQDDSEVGSLQTEKPKKWYHSSLREKVRRLEMSPIVKFGPEDKELMNMVKSLSKAVREGLGRYPEKGVKEVIVDIIQNKRRAADNCFDAICSALDPTTLIGPHRLVEAFTTRNFTACYDVSLMTHLVLEDLGYKGSHMVGFRSTTTNMPSFGLVYEGDILTIEKGKWVPKEIFQRLLRIEGKGDYLHNMYPPLSTGELLHEWADKGRSLLSRKRKTR